MKKISLIFLMVFGVNAYCQNLVKQLQEKTWYLTGDLLKHGKTVFHLEKPVTKNPAAKFLADGNFQLEMEEGFKFVCPYQLKKHCIKFHYIVNTPKESKKQSEVVHCFRIKELTENNFEFSPITEADFK